MVQSIIKMFYETWGIICALGIILGLVPPNVGNKENEKPQKVISSVISSIFFAVAIVSAIVGNYFVEVPEIENKMSVDSASGLLEKAGLHMLLLPNESLEGQLAQMVIFQSIEPGMLVPKGTGISIGYARTSQSGDSDDDTDVPIESEETASEEKVTVPQVCGLEQNIAIEILTQKGLNFQVWWTEENNVLSDVYYVIDQSIAEGEEVEVGTLIKLELSVEQP